MQQQLLLTVIIVNQSQLILGHLNNFLNLPQSNLIFYGLDINLLINRFGNELEPFLYVDSVLTILRDFLLIDVVVTDSVHSVYFP
jgi:hypothetical protein